MSQCDESENEVFAKQLLPLSMNTAFGDVKETHNNLQNSTAEQHALWILKNAYNDFNPSDHASTILEIGLVLENPEQKGSLLTFLLNRLLFDRSFQLSNDWWSLLIETIGRFQTPELSGIVPIKIDLLDGTRHSIIVQEEESIGNVWKNIVDNIKECSSMGPDEYTIFIADDDENKVIHKIPTSKDCNCQLSDCILLIRKTEILVEFEFCYKDNDKIFSEKRKRGCSSGKITCLPNTTCSVVLLLIMEEADVLYGDNENYEYYDKNNTDITSLLANNENELFSNLLSVENNKTFIRLIHLKGIVYCKHPRGTRRLFVDRNIECYDYRDYIVEELGLPVNDNRYYYIVIKKRNNSEKRLFDSKTKNFDVVNVELGLFYKKGSSYFLLP
ncbi:hypothetical protein COEREDRAFT_87969 [Coemansia reversa NRRL 1564]|uniref:Uncharacterized protein n=1 Tax=Coemansia reversa (strain ATCC 12441 / NRRL 1564) TaxID=763665 RepID=A0A2G5B8P5_COERN|nr:hypothetical protein COEREDRAFT_87969 [Coemansia reversa NRRL 1564]|eukprot:PIA15352.1 hypothetical protein COEREDRAFT_87969 [Coemansia reversa NRRL 1564]